MAKTKTKTVTVKKVINGDTFATEADKTIRITGVDTPERGKPGAAKARNYLRNQIEGERVVIKPVARDKYRRIVAYVYKQGKSINKKLKRKGF